MNQNPNWIRTTIASILLAIVLWMGLNIPFLSTFLVLGIIYLMNVVFTEMKSGVDKTWAGIEMAGMMAMGIVIFLALRLIIGGVLDLYPTETYREVMDTPGRLRRIFFGQGSTEELRRVLMFEFIFTLVAGGLSVAWTRKKKRGLVGGIFVISLLVLMVQIGLPKYSATFPSLKEVDQKLETNGGGHGNIEKCIPKEDSTHTDGTESGATRRRARTRVRGLHTLQ